MRSKKKPAPKRRVIKNEFHLNNAILKDKRIKESEYVKKELTNANK